MGGNFAITNARDVTVRNSDGSQRSLAVGIPIIIAKHDERIDKPACPSGLTPSLTTSIKGIFNETNIPVAFTSVGALRSYVIESSSYWTVKLDYWADVQGVKTLMHDGEIKAELRCTP